MPVSAPLGRIRRANQSRAAALRLGMETKSLPSGGLRPCDAALPPVRMHQPQPLPSFIEWASLCISIATDICRSGTGNASPPLLLYGAMLAVAGRLQNYRTAI